MDGIAPAIPAFPDIVRVGGALLWLLLPGFAFLARWGGAAPPGVPFRLALALACGLSVALGLSTLASLLGLTLDALVALHWVAFALAVGLGLRSITRRRPDRALGGAAGVGVGAALLLAIGLGVATTVPIGAASDVPDHVGTARAILERGELEPNTVFYASGDGVTPDPRKGPGHALLAALARTAGLDAVRTWYALRPFALAAGLLGFALLAHALTGGGLAFGLSLVAYPLVVHGNATWFLDAFTYPHNLNWLSIWVALALVVREIASPSAATKGALVLIGATLAGLHVFAPALLLAGTLSIVAAVVVLAGAAHRGRAIKTLGLVALSVAPLLAWRLATTYHPVNPLHTEASETFYFTSFLSLHSPAPLFRYFHPAGLALATLGILLVRRGASVTRASLVGLALGPMLVSLNPVMGGLLIPKIGYLFLRFLGLVPFPIVAGVLIAGGLGRLRDPSSARWVRFGAASVVGLVAVLLVVRVPALVGFVTRAPVAESPEAWHAGYALVDAHVEAGATVLTDPHTSYALPAYTGRRVVTALDQHSSPSDSTIRVRTDAVVRALSPYRPVEEAVDACRAYGVRAVLLNPHGRRRIESHADVRHPALFEQTVARFERSTAFTRIEEREGFVLFAFGPRAVGGGSLRERPPAHIESPGDVLVELDEAIGLLGTHVYPETVTRGDTLVVAVELQKIAEDPPATPYRIVVRLRQVLAGERARFSSMDRLYARLVRESGGPRLELAEGRRPLGGRYPFGIWDVGEAYADTFRIALPVDLEPGAYAIGVRMKPQRLIRNIALRDWLRPSGALGYEIGSVTIE